MNTKVLAIGAHPDDIEIGCGGTLAAHVAAGDEVRMVVLSAGEKGGADAATRLAEFEAAAKLLGASTTICLGYPDTQVPSDAEAIQKLEAVVAEFAPDRVYIPFWREIHQDHRHASELALSACRNIRQILAYEGPSTFPDFVATYYCDIAKRIEQKISAISAHKSQGDKEILKIEAIRSLNRFRGYQARTTYAEAFAVYRYIEQL